MDILMECWPSPGLRCVASFLVTKRLKKGSKIRNEADHAVWFQKSNQQPCVTAQQVRCVMDDEDGQEMLVHFGPLKTETGQISRWHLSLHETANKGHTKGFHLIICAT